MDPKVLIIIVVVAAAIVIAGLIFYRKHRSRQLREHFGPEYDRTVRERGNPGKAEMELLKREKRVEKFSIKPLSPADRDQYAQEWTAVQRRFVDDPSGAVKDADSLVNRVMVARGYPTSNFEQRAADISVSYPGVVQNYRSASAIAQRHGRGEAGTEDLRQAMVYYRSLFDELLELPKSADATRGVIHERAS